MSFCFSLLYNTRFSDFQLDEIQGRFQSVVQKSSVVGASLCLKAERIKRLLKVMTKISSISIIELIEVKSVNY